MVQVDGTTPGKFASYITTERERWIKVVKASGVLLGHWLASCTAG